MVEMHLLSVNAGFEYSELYALGVVTSFDRFMAGYQPETDKESIFTALCRSVGDDPQQYRQDAAALMQDVSGLSMDTLNQQLAAAKQHGGDGLVGKLHRVAGRETVKYSRLMAAGLYTLFEAVDSEALADKEQRDTLLTSMAEALNLPGDKVVKDLDLYRSNIEKMLQAQEVMKDMLEAERKKREQRAQAKADTAVEKSTEEAAES